jgi:hypothetical protein
LKSDYIILGNSIIDGEATARLLELSAVKLRSYELERENRELRRALKARLSRRKRSKVPP